MKFLKDLLFFDLQTTGPDPDKDSIIQLSAILVDRDNLLEKQFYNVYLRISLLDGTIQQHAQMLGIPFEILRKSPKPYDACKRFNEHFSTDVFLATFNPVNTFFLKNTFKKAAIPYTFDYHILDLWTLSYIYTLSYGFKKSPSFHTLLDHFGLQLKSQTNALERVRLQTEIFRKIIKAA